MLRSLFASFAVAALALTAGGARPRRFPRRRRCRRPADDRESFRDERHRSVPLLRKHEGSGRRSNFFKTAKRLHASVSAKLGAPRQRLFDRIKALDNAGVSVSSVVRDGDRYFYEKLKPGENSEKLYVREANGTERVLVDPEKLATAGKHYTINYFLPSLDGIVRRIRDLRRRLGGFGDPRRRNGDGNVLPDAIDRAYFVGATSWLPDGKSFYYVRFPELKPGEPETDKETRAVNYLHILGRDPDRDDPIFGYGVNPKVTFEATDFPIVAYSPASGTHVGYVVHGVKNEVEIYSTLATALTSGNVPWTSVVADDDDVTGFDVKVRRSIS